ncbi:MAG: hypothetical protein ACE5HK_00795 [Candidatus Methylomirabilales bacterium]
MKRIMTTLLALAVVGMTVPAFAQEYPRYEDPDWSPGKTDIFEMKTGREPGNLISVFGGDREPLKRAEHPDVLRPSQGVWLSAIYKFGGHQAQPAVRKANADRAFANYQYDENHEEVPSS